MLYLSSYLLLYLRHPVNNHVDWRGRVFQPCDYQEPLSVGGHNEAIPALVEELCLKKKLRRFRLERAGAGFYFRGHQFSVVVSKEQLFTIPPPLRFHAAVHGDLPLSTELWECRHVDLTPA